MEEKEKDKKIQDFGQVVLENNKNHGHAFRHNWPRHRESLYLLEFSYPITLCYTNSYKVTKVFAFKMINKQNIFSHPILLRTIKIPYQAIRLIGEIPSERSYHVAIPTVLFLIHMSQESSHCLLLPE